MELVAREFILKLNPKLCVLSTVGPKKMPQSAMMAYAVADGLTVILATHMDSRKWKNIRKNPSVALVFGSDFTGYNLQYEGEAKLVLEDAETEKLFYSANPFLVKFKDLPGNAFIKITPRWVRLSDFSVSPPKLSERRFDGS